MTPLRTPQIIEVGDQNILINHIQTMFTHSHSPMVSHLTMSFHSDFLAAYY
jgi:hypothetical protein